MKLIDLESLKNNSLLNDGISEEMLEILRIGGCQYIADSRFNIIKNYTDAVS